VAGYWLEASGYWQMADGPAEAEARNSKVPCPTDLKSQVPLPSPLSVLDTKPASSFDA
jgi:hypothetical protein